MLFLGICAGALVLAAFLLWCGKAPKPIRKTVANAAWGLLALFAVNLTGMLTTVTLPLSPLTVGVSLFASLPGVVTLLLLQLILGV